MSELEPIPAGAIPLEEYLRDRYYQPPAPGTKEEELPLGAVPEEEYRRNKAREHYETPGQQAKTVIEQGLSGATLGLSKVIETQGIPQMGIPPITTPEEVAAREEANPGFAIASNIVGTGAGLSATGGLGAVIKGATIPARIATAALEGAVIGGANQATDDWSQNKPLDAQRIAGAAGLGALLGGVGTGIIEGIAYKLGSPLAKGAEKAINDAKAPTAGEIRPISELDQPGYMAGEFDKVVQNSEAIHPSDAEKILEGINQLKPNAPEIVEAAKEIGSPVLEGMTSASPWVQKAEDALIKGAPTYSGVQRQGLYQQVYSAVKNATDKAIGEGSPYTKAQLGNALKEGITSRISNAVKPINELYSLIHEYYPRIPLSERSGPAIAKNIAKIPEVAISPSSPAGKIAKRVIEEIGNLKTVDDIKLYKSLLMQSVSPTASSGEKRMVSLLADKLSELEERSIIRFAENEMKTTPAKEKILQLLDQRKAADAAYAPFKQDLTRLGEQLGKGKVYGAQDAINFIQERITPEDVVKKLFSKNDSEFVKFFSERFPDEMKLMRDYQKDVIREASSKAGEGVLNPTRVFSEVNKLEPEIQSAIFTPSELQSLRSAEIVNRSIPKAFNPSGTADQTALRDFFRIKHIPLRVGAELRDKAIEQFIKTKGGNVQKLTSDALKAEAEAVSEKIDSGIGAIFEKKKGK